MLDTSKCQEYFDQVVEFAKKNNRYDGEDGLKQFLDYLDQYAGRDDTKCVLYQDFAPYSFEFLMCRKNHHGDWADWFDGGLIFHGSHDHYGGGSAPTFSTCLTATDGWSIHA